MDKDLTIIIPAFNEEKGIENTLQELVELVESKEWSILLIDDGSEDKTKNIAQKFEKVKIISHKTNRGYGASLKTGIRQAKSDLVAFYDADGQHNPYDLLKLYQNFDEADMLVGSRGKDSHQSLIRKPGKWVLRKVANYLTGKKIPDINSGLRIVRKEPLIKLESLFCDGFSFSTSSTIALVNMGYLVKYFPITVKKRVGSSSVKQVRHGFETIILMLRLIILFNPLKIFLRFSFFFFLLCLVNFSINDLSIDPFKIDITTSTLLLILSSMLTFLFGLVVDQISELRKNQFK